MSSFLDLSLHGQAVFPKALARGSLRLSSWQVLWRWQALWPGELVCVHSSRFSVAVANRTGIQAQRWSGDTEGVGLGRRMEPPDSGGPWVEEGPARAWNHHG